MADKINNLPAFIDAVYREFFARRNDKTCPFEARDLLGDRITDIKDDGISEAEYIKKWQP